MESPQVATDKASGRSGWLAALLERAVSEHRRDGPLTAPPEAPPGRPRARAYRRRVLRESGLLSGPPAMRSAAAFADRPPKERLFRAVIAPFARIALDVADLTGAPAGPR